MLNYIKNDDKRFQTFVANRIPIIHDGSLPSQWKYVPTETNPSDDASRGLKVDTVKKKNRWFDGPDFLWSHESTWPVQLETTGQVTKDNPEVKSEAQTLLTSADNGINHVNQLLEHFSSWPQLEKIVAWILRYREMLRASCTSHNKGSEAKPLKYKQVEPISAVEIEKAGKGVFKFVQLQSFREEVSQLDERRNGSEDSRHRKEKSFTIMKSSPFYKLDPVMIDGLMCVGGRLRRAPIPDQAKNQVILPKKHHVVNLLVQYYHLKSRHSGLEHVLSLVREKVWISCEKNLE